MSKKCPSCNSRRYHGNDKAKKCEVCGYTWSKEAPAEIFKYDR